MKNKLDYSLYVVTDRDVMSSGSIEESVERSIMGGATMIQLREKNVTPQEFFMLAKRVKLVTDKYNIPLIINDNPKIAKAVDAAGVHVGQSDVPCTTARQIVGPDKHVGVSVENVAQAIKAQNDGADCIGVCMFPTKTKGDARPTSLDTLRQIRASVTIPIVVIGGINKNSIPSFKGTGIDGIAVVSAVVAQPDPTAAAQELKKLFKETMAGSKRVIK